jgi:alpha-ketoglutarate-dependent taurine dioxygenase
MTSPPTLDKRLCAGDAVLAANDPRTWRADTLDAPPSWYVPLPGPCLEALAEVVPALADRPVTDTTLPPWLRAACIEALAPARAALEHGRGFVILQDNDSLSERERRLLYWLAGLALGRPLVQNVQGTLLYDVCDTGQDVRYGARFSVTNAESSFHTDGSFMPDVVDYVGLLCLKTARRGGRSQLVSGRAVHDELRTRRPDVLAVLAHPFHVERRGGVRPGEAPTARYPVLHAERGGLLWRYLRYWIEAGHQRAGEPLSPAQGEALDVLDGVLRQPGLHVEFDLAPGEMLFINNRWLLHNRTAFEDHAEPERRRHLVRLWLARPDS